MLFLWRMIWWAISGQNHTRSEATGLPITPLQFHGDRLMWTMWGLDQFRGNGLEQSCSRKTLVIFGFLAIWLLVSMPLGYHELVNNDSK